MITTLLGGSAGDIHMKIWVGTSGYVYPEWRGVLYPPGTSSAKMLTLYAEHFPLVELNFSYYRIPTANQLARMMKRVPVAFQFMVKAHKSITHEPDRRQLKVFAAGLTPLSQGRQLMGVLCQFPQRFHKTQANQEWIATIQAELTDVPLAVEFRHESWNCVEVSDWLRNHGITLVSVDVPEMPAIFPRKLVQSGDQIYVRLHSRRAATWFSAGPDRYDYLYSDAELREWIDLLSEKSEQAKRATVLFNNCRRANAVVNAERFIELLHIQRHPFEVVRPTLNATQQGILFNEE